MGLFDKVKSILFEEEEVEEEVTPTENKERTNVETSNKVEYKPLPVQENKANNVERVNVDVKPVEPTFEKVKTEVNDFSDEGEKIGLIQMYTPNSKQNLILLSLSKRPEHLLLQIDIAMALSPVVKRLLLIRTKKSCRR